jgi:hypothetical protein
MNLHVLNGHDFAACNLQTSVALDIAQNKHYSLVGDKIKNAV